jgi:hypothetical protein
VFKICNFNPDSGIKRANEILFSLLFDFPGRRLGDDLVRDIVDLGHNHHFYCYDLLRYGDEYTLDLIEKAGTVPDVLQFARIVFNISRCQRKFTVMDLRQCIQGINRQVLDWILYLFANGGLDSECLKLLVQEGANVNFVLPDHEAVHIFDLPLPLTPLSKAVRYGVPEIVDLLLRYGADVLLDTRGGFLSAIAKANRDTSTTNFRRQQTYTELAELLESLERAEVAKRSLQLPKTPGPTPLSFLYSFTLTAFSFALPQTSFP